MRLLLLDITVSHRKPELAVPVPVTVSSTLTVTVTVTVTVTATSRVTEAVFHNQTT